LKPKRTSVPWTPGEDALICRLRSKHSDYDEIAENLPHRTAIAVKRRVAHLITAGRIASQRAAWTQEEDALICELREQNVSLPGIAPLLEGRTAAAIAQRIQQLRLEGRVGDLKTPPESRAPWTDQEEAVIVQLRERGATVDKIAAELPHRTPGAVALRVRELLEADELERAPNAPHSMQAWTREEDELVTVMRRAEKPLEEIAAALGRSQASVSSHIAQRIRKGEVGLMRAKSDKRQPPSTGATETGASGGREVRAGQPPPCRDDRGQADASTSARGSRDARDGAARLRAAGLCSIDTPRTGGRR
jgi:DNA-binding CsgD family transcriptional regulator